MSARRVPAGSTVAVGNGGSTIESLTYRASRGRVRARRRLTRAAAAQVEAVQLDGSGIEELVGDKGYHSNQTVVDLQALGLRSSLSEPDPGPPVLEGAAGGPRRRLCQPAPDPRGRRLLRCRGGVVGAAVCASVRNRRDAAGASSRASEHPEAVARARRRLQPRAAVAAPDRRRHAPEPAGPGRGPPCQGRCLWAGPWPSPGS